MNKLISLKGISYVIDKKIIINNISLNIFKNQIIGLKGPNGAGKTTLLKLMSGLLQPTSGSLTRDYKDNFCTSFIFQNPKFLNSTVYNNLQHALYCRDTPRNMRHRSIKMLLERYSLEYLSEKHIHQLSGGELQLLSLLRSLIIQPKLIFYDEPTNNLDTNNASLILDILTNCIRNETQIILVTHDDRFANELNCSTVILEEGRIVYE